VTIQNHGLKPHQRLGAVPARIVRVPDRDEPGNPFVLRDAWREKLIKIGAKGVRHGRYGAIVRHAPPGLTRGADLAGFCVHRGEGSALPKSVERGNLSVGKAVIRWTTGGGSGGASPLPCTPPWRGPGREKVFA
jgi:hypothetical protein